VDFSICNHIFHELNELVVEMSKKTVLYPTKIKDDVNSYLPQRQLFDYVTWIIVM
jgi:hypothetical protein